MFLHGNYILSEERDPDVASMELPKSQSELPAKRMLDSYEAALIPLKNDKELRGIYVNSFNLVRYGRIMEDLDTLAGEKSNFRNTSIYSCCVFSFY
jgi:hypothetical protein